MKKKDLLAIKTYIEKIAVYTYLEKLLNQNNKLTKQAANGNVNQLIRQLIQQLNQNLGLQPHQISTLQPIFQELIEVGNTQTTGEQPPLSQQTSPVTTGEEPQVGVWEMPDEYTQTTQNAPSMPQQTVPTDQAGGTGRGQAYEPNERELQQQTQLNPEAQQVANNIEQLFANFLGPNSRNVAQQFPQAYQAVVNLQKKLSTLLNISNIQQTLQMEGVFEAYYDRLNKNVKDAIKSLIGKTTKMVQNTVANPQAGQTGLDKRIQTLRQTAQGNPVVFTDPGNGQQVNAVLQQAAPNRIILKTNRRTITLDRNDPDFEKLVNSIRPLSWGERLNPITQLRSAFQEKKKIEMTKLADRLDLMGYKKQAKRVDTLIQKIS